MRCSPLECATVTLLVGAVGGGCSGYPTESTEALTFTYDFDRGPQGFIAGFADYPPADAESYALTSDHRGVPPPLEPRSALFISGVNRRDDLFMWYCQVNKRRLRERPLSGLLEGSNTSSWPLSGARTEKNRLY